MTNARTSPSAMSAITISRQMGSRGDEIASQVARRLGWQQVSRDLINQAALAAGVPQVALAQIDELDFFGLRPSAREWQAYRSQVERIISHLVDEGKVVIVGRGSQMVLRDRPDVVHVRVVAPLETRVTWLQQGRKISAESARAYLEAGDRARARYLQHNYGVAWDDLALYHLTINTGLLDLPQAVNLIVQACGQGIGG